MENDNIIKALAVRIKKNTELQNLSWTSTSRNNSYEAKLGNGSVMISFNDNPLSSYDYELDFLNVFGESIGRLSTHEGKSKTEFTSFDHDLLVDIYELAHNSYLKTDETFKSMMEDLNSREEIF